MSAIYLDYAAATPLEADVLETMQPYFDAAFYNPSATYQAARDVHKSLDAARQSVAAMLGSRPSEVLWTAGGTESDNIAVHGVMRRFPEAEIITSAIEHDAVLQPAKHYKHSIAPVNEQGIIDLNKLEQMINDNTVLISVMYANNEVGTVQPIAKIAALIAQERSRRREHGIELPLYFHSDACQAANYLDIHVSRLGVDLLTLGGGKIYGPKQVGALYIKGGLELAPLIDGGGQERGLRSGTENVSGVIGFAAALQKAQALRSTEIKRMHDLQQVFFKMLKTYVPTAVVRGSLKLRLPNNVHITLPGLDNERVLIQLDEAGIQAAAGSACSASNETASHVLAAMGLRDEEARSSLRFTMGRATTKADIKTTVETLQRLVA